MKMVRRIVTLVLTLMCIFSLGTVAMAQEDEKKEEELTHLSLLEELCWSYLDQRFERYTSVPQYFQQDYAHVPYGGGGGTIANTGCGITTLSMLATYMTDTEMLAPELADMFRSYSSPLGTAYVLFDDSPAVLGYYLQARDWRWSEAEKALNNGQMVVCLQKDGRFTSSAHFLVLTRMTDDGRVMIMDCNSFNHRGQEKFYDGYENGFYVEDITARAQIYWIYEKKVVRTATCANCGEGGAEGVPTQMFAEDYYCSKCRIKLHKKEIYQDICHIDFSVLNQSAPS